MGIKTHIRQQALSVREALTMEECAAKSAVIIKKIIKLEEYQRAKCILTYVEYHKEVMTTPLIKQALEDGKEVYCPRVEGNTMEFYKVLDDEKFEVSKKGIREPIPILENVFEATTENLRYAVCIVPGVVFDKKKHRIGYGKGFYDRYLSDKEELTTIAVCFDCQILEDIPFKEHDISPDLLFTETRKI